MGTLLGLIFYVLVMSSLLLRSEGTVYSTPDTALKFTHCLIDKISESPFFTIGVRDSMIDVADTMATAMRRKLPNYRMASSTKVLTIAFLTSMADVVISEDSTTNLLRKQVYSEALEQCSVSSTGYIDKEFIKEALSIFTTVENSKASEYSDSSYYSEEHFEPDLQTPKEYFEPDLHTSEEYFEPDALEEYYEPDLRTPEEYFEPDFDASVEIFNPREVKPSPVVTPINPAPANFNPIFRLPQSSFQFSAVPSVWPSNTNIQLPNQPESYMNLPSKFHSSGIFQSGGNVGIDSSIAQGSISPVLGTSSQSISPEFKGLRTPQMKQSEVVAIPPLDNSQFGKIPFQDQVPKTSEGHFQLPDLLNTSPENGKSISITSSASLPRIHEQGSDAFSTPLKNMIYDILSNSSAFLNAFPSGIEKQRALNLARTITEQSLSGHPDIVNDAIKAVSDAISRMTFKSPVGYARAIANSLTAVLQHSGMSLFVDGARTASDFLSNLPGAKKVVEQPVVSTDDGKNFSAVNIPSQEQEKPPFDFETHTVAPEDINGEIFGNTLSQYLRESPEISNIFCNPGFSTDRIQIYFSIIKASLVEYGVQISSIAATVTSGALAELSEEEMCSKYSQVISQTIAEVLDENKLLNNANPEEIFKRMKFNLKQKQALTAQTQQPKNIHNIARNSTKNTRNSFAQIITTLQPSFGRISNKYEEESKVISLNFNQTPTDYVSPTTEELYTNLITDLSEVMKKQEKYTEETTEKTFAGSSIPVPTSSMNKPVIESDEESALDILATAVFTDITDEEMTSAISLTDLISSISESTADTLSSSDYTTEDYGDLVDFLFEELESVLTSQSGDGADSSTESTSEIGLCDDDKFLGKEVSTSDESSAKIAKTISNRNNPRNEDMFKTGYSQRNRRKMKRKITTFQMDITTQTPNAGFNHKRGEGDDSSTHHTLTQSASSHRQAGSKSRVQIKVLPSNDTSRDSPLRDMSEKISNSTVLQNNPVRRRNSRRRQGSAVSEGQDSSSGDSLLTRRRTMSARAEDDDKVPSHKPRRGSSRRPSGSTHKNQEKDVLPEESFFPDSSTKRPPVHLQPSFQEPLSSDSFPSVRINARRTNSRSSNFNDPKNSSEQLASAVSRIATSSIDYIRSDNFNFYELCGRLNELAHIANIPPVDNCNEIALIDFLLHVLRSVTNKMKRA